MSNARLALFPEGDMVWMTDERSNLIKYNPSNKDYEVFNYVETERHRTQMHWCIHRDKRGKLWRLQKT